MPPSLDRTINLGSVLMVLTMIVSVTAAWIANRERTLDNQARIVTLSVEIDNLEARIRSLEISVRDHNPPSYPR
jgi:hypothetical protein